MTNENHLASAKKIFVNYKLLGEKAMAQLDPDEFFQLLLEDINTIAVIVQHLAGNMLSRWTDFLTTDGEKDWRNRDAEFETVLKNKDEVMLKWEEGWACLFNAIDQLQPTQLEQIVLIRNEPHTVLEAINRQLSHYPYHVGQIIFCAKVFKGNHFKSLSIPRNKSGEFNAEKFGQGN